MNPILGRNRYVPDAHGWEPRWLNMTGITDYLAENNMSLSILEVFDKTLKGTRQTDLISWGLIPEGQKRLSEYNRAP
jgi:hypothetical protein